MPGCIGIGVGARKRSSSAEVWFDCVGPVNGASKSDPSGSKSDGSVTEVWLDWPKPSIGSAPKPGDTAGRGGGGLNGSAPNGSLNAPPATAPMSRRPDAGCAPQLAAASSAMQTSIS